MRIRTLPFAIAGIAATSLLITSCSGASPTSDATGADADGYVAQVDDGLEPTGGTLNLQLDYDTAETGGLDPATAEIARSWSIEGLVYESLVTMGPSFEIQPELAESWEQTDDTTYVFTLREGATFSNGRDVTADDVVGSLDRLIELGAVWSSQLGPIDSIENTSSGDAQEVTITLATPYTPLLAALANTPAAVLPMQELEAGEFDPATEMLGSGPFTMAEHRQDESWTFEANPEWWNAENLGVDTVEIGISSDDQTRLAALRDGSTQFATFANPDALNLLSQTGSVTAVSQEQSDYFYLMLNSVNPDSPFVDDELRNQVNAALDRQQIADIALAGAGSPTAVTPSNLPGACSVDSLPSTSVEADATAFEGQEFTLLIYSGDPSLSAVGQVVQQQLEQLGATVNLETLDYGTYSERVYATQPGDFEMALGWFAGYGDASMVTSWWNPDTAFFNAGFTQSHDDLNEAIATAQQLPDGDERTAALADVCGLADGYAEMIPLATRPTVIGFRGDQVQASILAGEGYGDFLRGLPEFRLTQG
ncbi:ABC transporter substrate-binding protein [Gulosibacter sp. ACHW.36C]|uniref:ABC transporter substrate-binding protein n=1 Tax=Gulosibacter sediminis TaxID=1729695 RepID=A0ABY4MYI9_9MICO|nr:ABC transporter substrate-binding protein [Gulosibacter sediminis]UQN14834.1 ABC transporter substrate-binding protein [Gulosibacter sediminis]